MPKFLRHLLTLALFLAPELAFAQATVLQGGAWTSGHFPQYSTYGGQPVIIDGGGAAGGALGQNASEFGITSRSPTNTYPSASSGSGPLATHGCLYDAPTTNATGYHYLCFDPNAGGGGLIAYGYGGGASAQNLIFDINGSLFNPAQATNLTVNPYNLVGNTTATAGGVASVPLSSSFSLASGSLAIAPSGITASMLASGAAVANITASSITASMLASGAAVANIGYTPLGPLSGDVATIGNVATIQPNAVTNAKLATTPANTIKGNNTGSTSSAVDLTVAQVTAMLASPTSSKTAAYTVTSADANSTIVLGGSAFYAVTFGTVGGYATGKYTIQNNDTRGKRIVLTGGSSYTIWPGQSDVISNITGAWVPQNGPTRWVANNNVAQCYVDNVLGKTAGNTDGLVAGAGAFTTFQGCYKNALDNYSLTGSSATGSAGGISFLVNLTAGQTYTVTDDFVFNGLVPGTAGMAIYGNSSTIFPSGAPTSAAAVAYIGVSGQVSIGNVTVGCSTTGCSDFSISYPGELNLYSPIVYGSCYISHIQASGPGSVLYVLGTNFAGAATSSFIAGNCGNHLQAADCSVVAGCCRQRLHNRIAGKIR